MDCLPVVTGSLPPAVSAAALGLSWWQTPQGSWQILALQRPKMDHLQAQPQRSLRICRFEGQMWHGSWIGQYGL